MDILRQLNAAMGYVESHLCDEIDLEEISRIALCTPDSFSRFFSYMTRATIKEYIRCRRLTLAAYELRRSDARVIDVALKYGYSGADAFSKAFRKQHGVTPTEARALGSSLKVYPPASFHIMIKGARPMDLRIADIDDTRLYGVSKRFAGEAADRFEQEHIMWADDRDDVTSRICATIPGVWYGIWDSGVYSVARESSVANASDLELITIPRGKYAVFTSDRGGFAGDVLPRLRDQVFSAWLADSGYRQTSDYEVEVYHLYSRSERYKRYYEIWIPVADRELA